MRERLGLESRPEDDRTGLVMLSVRPQSPADVYGFVAGDVVVEVADRSIHTVEELGRRVAAATDSIEVKLRDYRTGNFIPYEVLLRDTTRFGAVFREATAGAQKMVRVLGVFPGSPADRIGLVRGDYLRAVNAAAVNDLFSASDAIRTSPRTMQVEILKGQTNTVETRQVELQR